MRCAASRCGSEAALIRSPSSCWRLECIAILERHRLLGTDLTGGAGLGKRGIAVGNLGVHVAGLGDYLGAGERPVLFRDADTHVLTAGDASARDFPGLVVALSPLRFAPRVGLLAGAVGAGSRTALRSGILRIRPLLLAAALCFRLSLVAAGFLLAARLVGSLPRLIAARLPLLRLPLLGTALRTLNASAGGLRLCLRAL